MKLARKLRWLCAIILLLWILLVLDWITIVTGTIIMSGILRWRITPQERRLVAGVIITTSLRGREYRCLLCRYLPWESGNPLGGGHGGQRRGLLNVAVDTSGHSCGRNICAGQRQRSQREGRLWTYGTFPPAIFCLRRRPRRRRQGIHLADLVKVRLAFRKGRGLATIWCQPPDETSYRWDISQETFVVIATEIGAMLMQPFEAPAVQLASE